jgi:hypothetical protein
MLADPAVHLDEYHVGHWIMFVRSLLHRSPSNLAEYQSTGVKVWRETLKKMEARYDELRQDTDPPSHAEYVASLPPMHGAARVLESLPTTLASNYVLQELSKAPWLLFNVPNSSPSLLLSDAPIVRTNGFHTENGHIAMPLSPRRFLLIARDRKVAESIDRTPIRQLVKSLNRSVVEQARHFVAATDLRQISFISKHFNPPASSGEPHEVAG